MKYGLSPLKLITTEIKLIATEMKLIATEMKLITAEIKIITTEMKPTGMKLITTGMKSMTSEATHQCLLPFLHATDTPRLVGSKAFVVGAIGEPFWI